MPVLDPERSTPRSTLRYRPSRGDDQVQSRPGPVTARKSRLRTDAQTTAAPVLPDDLEEEEYVPRRRRVTRPDPRPSAAPVPRTLRRLHPLFWLGIIMFAMIVFWLCATQVLSWGTNAWNNIRYGTPRTYQIDAIVSQGDSPAHPSHFIAINLHGQISVIDFPAGDASRARDFIITTLVGPNSDLDPVTLRFIDINRNGHPDMLIDADGIQSVLINDQGTFRSPTPVEQQQVQQYLQTHRPGS